MKNGLIFFRRLLLCALAGCLLTSCDSPDRTIGTLRKDLAAYKVEATAESQARIEAGFQKLDTQIADLKTKGRTAEAAIVESSAANLRADYRAARMAQTLKDAQSAIHSIGTAIKDAGKSIGDAFKEEPTPTP